VRALPAIAIEEAAQEAPVEVARTPLQRRRDGLIAGSHADALGKLRQRCQAEAMLVAAAHLVPAQEVGPVWQSLRGPQSLLHHAVDARARRRVHGRRGTPDGEDGLVGLEGAVSHKQPQQVAFLAGEIAAPRRLSAMIVEDDEITRPQLGRGSPFGIGPVARGNGDTPDAMVGRQPQGMAFDRLQP
jgi:hypothetical protein